MNKLAVIGYSGHALVCIDVAKLKGIEIEGYYDIKKKEHNPYNLNYLGKEDEIISSKTLFISIGDNNIRHIIYNKLKFHNNFNVNLIHPAAIVSNTAHVQSQVLVCASATINTGVNVGVGSIINTGAVVDHECEIGSFSHIAPSATLLGNVKIGQGCLIGANATIKQNVKIGDYSIIGAGAVVLKDVPPYTTYVGNPAKKIYSK